MRRRIGHGLPILFAGAISGGLFYFAVRDVRWQDIVAILPRVRWAWLLFLPLIPILDLWVRALRWNLLFAPMLEAPPRKLFQLEAIGLAINNLLFLRVGELARGYVAGKELGISTASALGTILVERLCDTFALLALFGLCAFALPEVVDPRIRTTALALAAGLLLALALVATLDMHIQLGKPWLRALKSYPRVHLVVEELMVGGRALRSPGAALGILSLSLGLWASDSLLFWAGARTLSFDPPLSYSHSVAVVAVGAGASFLPAIPGSFGNFEAFVKYILLRFGYGKALAIGYAAFVHLVVYIIVTVLGVACLYRLGHTFSGLRKALESK